MTEIDLQVKNGKVYLEGRLQSVDLWIKDGRIAEIGKSRRASEVLDARGLIIIPGAIDMHVHFRDPGYTYKEDWMSGSASAAAGGVTCVVDQPNTDPQTLDSHSYREKLERAKSRSLVDFGLNGGPGGSEKVKQLAQMGAMAIGEIFTYEHDYNELKKILDYVNDSGLRPTIHAEDEAILRECTTPLLGRREPELYSQARPNRAEAVAIQKVLRMTNRAHICHLSTQEGLNLIRSAREKGKKITCEVAPHHLIFTKKDWRSLGTFLKTNPPVRDSNDKMALWEGLRRGEIEVLASDHAPHLPAEKKEEIWDAPPGVPGVETIFPLMLNAVKSNFISMERMLDAISNKPARILGLTSKGRIARGMDADLVFVNPRNSREIRADDLHSGAEWTPFQGKRAIFPKITMVRGKVVAMDGEIVAKPGFGRYVPGSKVAAAPSKEDDDYDEELENGTEET